MPIQNVIASFCLRFGVESFRADLHLTPYGYICGIPKNDSGLDPIFQMPD
ncbi:hypothetical protein SAMN03159406_04764 [Rhizobium sp. NFR03]|nr:hypothetical protein SAMN03159406_04764 [Rhizobium sp. NFR03]